MDRRLSRTALPAVAATVLAALLAQPILAAKPTVTHARTSAVADGALGSEATGACGIGTITATVAENRTTVTFPARPGDGRLSVGNYSQRITFTHVASGATARLALAGVVRTYREGGALYVVVAGRSLNLQLAGRVVFRNGTEIERTGRRLTYATTVCDRLATRSSAQAAAARGGEAAAAAGPAESGPERIDRSRDAAAHARKDAR